MSGTADTSRRLPWWAWPLIVAGTMMSTLFRGWDRAGWVGVLDDAGTLLAFYIAAGVPMWLVETRLRGRARLWGRIAQISFWIGAVVFGVAWYNGTMLLAGAFWAFVTGAMVLLMALRRDVTT